MTTSKFKGRGRRRKTDRDRQAVIQQASIQTDRHTSEKLVTEQRRAWPGLQPVMLLYLDPALRPGQDLRIFWTPCEIFTLLLKHCTLVAQRFCGFWAHCLAKARGARLHLGYNILHHILRDHAKQRRMYLYTSAFAGQWQAGRASLDRP